MYASMAREELDLVVGSYDDEDVGVGLGSIGTGVRGGLCGSRRQQRVRADLMLTVLYDMLGQYDESDDYLEAAFNVRSLFAGSGECKGEEQRGEGGGGEGNFSIDTEGEGGGGGGKGGRTVVLLLIS